MGRGLVTPVVASAAQQVSEACRDANEQAAGLAAGLDEKHSVSTGLRQAAREDAPRRAAPDDQVVDVVHWRLRCVVTAHAQVWVLADPAGVQALTLVLSAACYEGPPTEALEARQAVGAVLDYLDLVEPLRLPQGPLPALAPAGAGRPPRRTVRPGPLPGRVLAVRRRGANRPR